MWPNAAHCQLTDPTPANSLQCSQAAASDSQAKSAPSAIIAPKMTGGNGFSNRYSSVHPGGPSPALF
jgi:hypothetical protein